MMLDTASERGRASDDLSMTSSEMATLPTRVAYRDVDGCSDCYERCDESAQPETVELITPDLSREYGDPVDAKRDDRQGVIDIREEKSLNLSSVTAYCRENDTADVDYDCIVRVMDENNTERVLNVRMNWANICANDCDDEFDYDRDDDCVDLNIEADPVRRVDSESAAILTQLTSTEMASTPEEGVLRDGDCREPGWMSSPVVEPDARFETRSIDATEAQREQERTLRRETGVSGETIDIVKMTLAADVSVDTDVHRRVDEWTNLPPPPTSESFDSAEHQYVTNVRCDSASSKASERRRSVARRRRDGRVQLSPPAASRPTPPGGQRRTHGLLIPRRQRRSVCRHQPVKVRRSKAESPPAAIRDGEVDRERTRHTLHSVDRRSSASLFMA